MIEKPKLTRREFLRLLAMSGISVAAGGTLLSLTGCDSEDLSNLAVSPSDTTQPTATSIPTESAEDTTEEISAETAAEEPTPVQSDLAIARGNSPTALVNAAVAALGGIEAFVKPGDDVIIKPNIVAADYSFEYAAFTNPEVVAAVTALCISAGAGRVRVMDRPSSSTCEQVYARSGIGDAVKAVGGEMEVMSDLKYRKVDIPNGRDIKSWSVYGDVLDADVFINVPIAKHHSLSKLTLSMKNLMGVITKRNKFHRNLGQRLADLSSVVRPSLTIMDAVNILMDNGPRGGNLNDVKQMNTVVASQDFVAVSSYTATFFNQIGSDIDQLRYADEMGLGTLDYNSLRINEVSV